jgi:O-antigen/teichoic acid export membrane protein
VPIYLAEKRFGIFWSVRISTAVLYLLLLLLLFFTGFLNVLNCVLVSLASLVGTTIFALVIYLKGFNGTLSWDVGVFKSMATYGIKTNLSGFPYQLSVRLDQLLMSLLLPERVLGYYVVAVAWSSMLSFLGGGVSTVMLSRSVLTDGHDQRRLSDLLAQFRLVSILLMVLGGGVAIATPLCLPLLFGSEFKPSIFPAMVLCLASVVMNITLVLHELTRGLGFPGLGIRAEVAGLLVTVPLLVVLLPVWQGMGAALVALFSRLFALGVLIHLLARKVDVPVSECVMPTRADWARARAWLKRGNHWLFYDAIT